MKIIFRSVCSAVIICCMLSLAGFSGACDDIEENVLRLHILANSDSYEDQQLKLKLRDAILAFTDELFADCSTKKQSMDAAQENIDLITEKAQSIIRAEGYDYPVQAYVTNMSFDTRAYDEFTLPAGNYDALRIVIGEGGGHNWWCVLYPAVCVPSAEKDIGSVLNENETDIVTDSDRYIVSFKIVEIFESIVSLFH